MTALQLAPSIVALVLLGAHYLRSESYAAVAFCAALIALLFVRRRWACRIVQAALVLGALEWLRSAFVLVNARVAMGEPYARLAAILGGVALFTLLAALVLQRRRARAFYGFEAGPSTGAAAAGDRR